MIRRYSELIMIPSFEERYKYLKLDGHIGDDTFGYERYLNQDFYTSYDWKRLRDFVITRDMGQDMAFPGEEIVGKIIVHHMNPISANDILSHSDTLLDPENLVCVSLNTHNMIHYGAPDAPVREVYVERKPNDTCLWRN